MENKRLYTREEMEEYYQMRILGLIQSGDRIGEVSFYEGENDEYTIICVRDTKGSVIKTTNVGFFSMKRACEKFIQEAIDKLVK